MSEKDSPPKTRRVSPIDAASVGEQLSSQRGARLMYVEDDVPSLLADYREGR